MGKVKRLWQDKIEAICKDYCESVIAFEDAVLSLYTLGYNRIDARDMLDTIKQLPLFPDEVSITIKGDLQYGKESKGPTEGKQEQTTSNTKGSSPKDSK